MVEIAGVVLAAGEGSRLMPITSVLPKPLCPVAGVALVDSALNRLATVTTSTAINLHHRAEAVIAHLDGLDQDGPTKVNHVSLEPGRARGTAGGIGLMSSWVAGRDVLVTNSDAWFAEPPDLSDFVAGWDRRRSRLLCVEANQPADFGTLRYCGVALIPAAAAANLDSTPSGLYERVWADEWARGQLDLVSHPGIVIDCGTPRDYLRANMLATGGHSQVEGAIVEQGAVVTRSVVWPGSRVVAGEVLVDAVRARSITVMVR